MYPPFGQMKANLTIFIRLINWLNLIDQSFLLDKGKNIFFKENWVNFGTTNSVILSLSEKINETLDKFKL
jgi:hypothetical protein